MALVFCWALSLGDLIAPPHTLANEPPRKTPCPLTRLPHSPVGATGNGRRPPCFLVDRFGRKARGPGPVDGHFRKRALEKGPAATTMRLMPPAASKISSSGSVFKSLGIGVDKRSSARQWGHIAYIFPAERVKPRTAAAQPAVQNAIPHKPVTTRWPRQTTIAWRQDLASPRSVGPATRQQKQATPAATTPFYGPSARATRTTNLSRVRQSVPRTPTPRNEMSAVLA